MADNSTPTARPNNFLARLPPELLADIVMDVSDTTLASAAYGKLEVWRALVTLSQVSRLCATHCFTCLERKTFEIATVADLQLAPCLINAAGIASNVQRYLLVRRTLKGLRWTPNRDMLAGTNLRAAMETFLTLARLPPKETLQSLKLDANTLAHNTVKSIGIICERAFPERR